ncbi:MAG TPA: MBOAT family protein [Candidatus Binatia bacterium]|jgi:alginate O-acetyltransferase complex protein AlgI
MLFSDPRFFVFLAGLLALLAVLPSNRSKKQALAIASCLFYAAWDYRYPPLLLLVAAVGQIAALRIAATSDGRLRRRWLVLSIGTSLSVLGYFKYTNFFLGTINMLVPQAHLPILNVLLPAGISFYTFKTMSYAIDVYRGELPPCRSLLDYITFATFFPELIAGPIVRASVFLPQMGRPIGPSKSRLAIGASVFLLGLTKKLLIADRLGQVVDPIFAQPALYSSVTIWAGVVAYTAQIYCDFSGYSDMAIGTAKMIGYDLPQNFRMPYLSANIADFWRRWHITLSSWLRDYLYIPLGGNRHGTGRTYVNLMLTMALGGLWHGASWNFVAWGTMHGLALAAHRAWGRRVPMPRAVATALTLLFVMLCWIPFRAPNVGATLVMLKGCFVPHDGVVWLPTALGWCLVLLVIGHIVGATLDRVVEESRRLPALVRTGLAMVGATLHRDDVTGWYVELAGYPAGGAFLIASWVLLIFLFAPTTTQPFIYFQF